MFWAPADTLFLKFPNKTIIVKKVETIQIHLQEKTTYVIRKDGYFDFLSFWAMSVWNWASD